MFVVRVMAELCIITLPPIQYLVFRHQTPLFTPFLGLPFIGKS